MTRSSPAEACGALLGVAIAVAPLVGIACGGTGNANGEATSGTTEGTTGTGDGAGSTSFAPDACMSSDECETSGHCIAPYDPAPPSGTPGRGPAECVDACIAENDLQRWCLDDVACCDGLRCSEVDGFCASTRPEDASGTSSGPVTGGDTGPGTGTAGTTDASSSDGTAATEGSSTGSATTGTG